VDDFRILEALEYTSHSEKMSYRKNFYMFSLYPHQILLNLLLKLDYYNVCLVLTWQEYCLFLKMKVFGK